MKLVKRVSLLVTAIGIASPSIMLGASELAPNGGFENGFADWTRWGTNADLITTDAASPHAGAESGRIKAGHNALYFTMPVTSGTAYELKFFYRLSGDDPAGEVALNYQTPTGALRSAGHEIIPVVPARGDDISHWTEFRKTFLPTSKAAVVQVCFKAGPGSTIWIDDVSLREVPRPAGLTEAAEPWEGLKRRTQTPLFADLLTTEPGGYTVVCWAHDLRNLSTTDAVSGRKQKGARKPEDQQQEIYQEAAQAGMGFMDLPGVQDGAPAQIADKLHTELFQKYGVKFDVWSEGGPSLSAAVQRGAEVLNPSGVALGRKPVVSFVDPNYTETQAQVLKQLATRLRGRPFVGYYYAKDEPTIHIPDGKPDTWGAYGKAMASQVREMYGFGKFDVPLPSDRDFKSDPQKPLRWIAYNRWANEEWIASRAKLREALRQGDPQARYNQADYWFMSGFVPYDYSHLAAASDLMELDPYASSAERRRGRGVFNHGFGAKLMSDLTGKRVRIIAQAFDYAGYDMKPDDLREWVSQALRCGATDISYYTMDKPRATHPDRWAAMLQISKALTTMKHLALPREADTAVLFSLPTHMSQGYNTNGDQLYAAHALLGELAGSWFKFVTDAQLERGDASLKGYKVVYLPLGRYMTPKAAGILEGYVRDGGVLVCGDAEAFASDLTGRETTDTRERILGVQVLGPMAADQMVLKIGAWDLPSSTALQLFALSLWDDKSAGCARLIACGPDAKVIGTYPDGSPAIVERSLGKGRVITFAANPFAPEVTVDKTQWPALFHGLQKSLGCKTDLPIWRFKLPTAAK